MNKLAYLAAALLCCPLVPAQEISAPAAAEITVSEAETVLSEMIADMKETLDILEAVKDKAGADAAAEKLAVIKTRILSAESTLEKISSLDEESQKKIAAKLLPSLFMLAPRMEKVTKDFTSQNFYGSDALKTILEIDEEESEEMDEMEG